MLILIILLLIIILILLIINYLIKVDNFKPRQQFKYIVSLTTIPPRINNLEKTIDSLINQTLKPNKIILNIPKKYNFRFTTEINLDKILKKYSNNITINLIENDYGPGTKLLGLINSKFFNLLDNNSYIVLVDDDMIYKKNMLEYFNNYNNKYYKNNNDYINIGSFYVYKFKDINIGQGADGLFIKYNKLGKFNDYYNLIKKFKYINFHDDFYISYYFYLKQYKIIHILLQNKQLIYDKTNNNDKFGLINLDGDYKRDSLNNKLYDILNSLNLDNKFKEIKNRKILFIYENKDKTINFNTILNEINGGSENVMFFIAKNLVHHFNIYIYDPKSNTNYIQNNINFINSINEKDYDIIIDTRDTKRNNFIKDKKYIVHHHDHIQHLKNINKFKKFNEIVTISNSQYNLWNEKFNYKYKNLHIINNPFLDENIHRDYKYNKFKIVSFASKTNFHKLFNIFNIIYKLDNRYKLYITSPNYKDISNLKINNKNIVNLNSLKHADMLNFLKDSFVFLYPTNFCESYGCVFDECLYYGVPIVTDYVKDSRINEIENETGIYIFKNKNNDYDMANLIHSWNINNNRPIIRWNHNNEQIFNQWIKLLNY